MFTSLKIQTEVISANNLFQVIDVEFLDTFETLTIYRNNLVGGDM